MPQTIAVILADTLHTRFGMPSRLGDTVAGRTVLSHTLHRAARIPSVQRLVVIHPAGQNVQALVDDAPDKAVDFVAIDEGWSDPYQPARLAARKWSLAGWRGGLGGATCYDELLPAEPIHRAMEHADAEAAVLVGGDWMLVDPTLCEQLLHLHIEHPEAMPMTFTQAPPGLAGIAVSHAFVRSLVKNPGSSFGQVLAYNPMKAQADPIGKDVCLQVPAAVREVARRFIYDMPRSVRLIDRIVRELGEAWAAASAQQVTAAARVVEARQDPADLPLPQQVTIELTPRREVHGPIVPQHHVALPRGPMSTDVAMRIIEQLGREAMGDTALTLGGLGDALLHPDWARVVAAAHEAGVLGICVETDLLVDDATLDAVLEQPVDVLSVRLNANSVATYQKVMGVDGYDRVIDHLKRLFENRQARSEVMQQPVGLPWIVPHLVKTADTLEDMELFYDKWIHYLGQAVIAPASSGAGLIPEQSPVVMAPPQRRGCRQVGARLTVLSTGCVAQCDQDWLGAATQGDLTSESLAEVWKRMATLRKAHADGRWNDMELCARCREWHRP